MATAKKTSSKKDTPKRKTTTTKKAAGKKSDPCWDGYEQIGTKTKAGKTVPNCVPEK